MFKILIAAGKTAGQNLGQTLAGAGYEPVAAEDGGRALAVLTQRYIDLAVVDLGRAGGFALLARLRQAGFTLPVLALAGHADCCRALRGGADDCMAPPAGPEEQEELLLRTAALLRRAQAASSRRLAVGGTTLRCDDHSVTAGGVQVVLPRKEFLLLYKLLSCPGKTFTRRQLMDEIWDMDTDSDEHTVNVHINRLRSRFRHNPDFAILTVRGLGYRAVRL